MLPGSQQQPPAESSRPEGGAGTTGSGKTGASTVVSPAPAPSTLLRVEPHWQVASPDISEREQAAALLMAPVTSYDDALAALTAGVGGIFITGWAHPELLSQPGRDIAALRAHSGRDFQVAIDFEGGRVQRFAEILGWFDSPQAIAAGADPHQVEAAGHAIGVSLAARGITVDFAPVLDVDGAGLSVVGDRAFSHDPAVAGDMGAAFARGLAAAGVQPVYKHFPGHGRASADSHFAQAVTPPASQLTEHEFIPFQRAVSADIPGAAVMMGHLVVPDWGQLPASLNPVAYQVARDQIGIAGPIYTDDIGGMRAVSDLVAVPDAAAQALAAGADIALWSTPVDVNAVVDAVLNAVHDGSISPEHFDAAYWRATTGRVKLEAVWPRAASVGPQGQDAL